MDRLPVEVIVMILETLNPRYTYLSAEEIDSGIRRTNADIKSMRLCSRQFAAVAARQLFREVWLCLHSKSFAKVDSIIKHSLYSGMVRELQIFPDCPNNPYSPIIDDGLEEFYDLGEGQTMSSDDYHERYIARTEGRHINVQRFLELALDSFKNLVGVRYGDCEAFPSTRRLKDGRINLRFRSKNFYEPSFDNLMEAGLVFKIVTQARRKLQELQLCGVCHADDPHLTTRQLESGEEFLDGIEHLRLNTRIGGWTVSLLTLCPNLKSLCIAGPPIRGERSYDMLGNELRYIHWPHLKTLSLSRLTVGADELGDFLGRHKPTLAQVSLWKLVFLCGFLFQFFYDLREREPCPALEVTDLAVLPYRHLFPAKNEMPRALLDAFLHRIRPESTDLLLRDYLPQRHNEGTENLLRTYLLDRKQQATNGLVRDYLENRVDLLLDWDCDDEQSGSSDGSDDGNNVDDDDGENV